MRFFPPLCQLVLIVVWATAPRTAHAEPAQTIELAAHNQPQHPPAAVTAQAVQRIRKIILNQGDDARALANLVQLTRKLPASTTAQLYYDLANDYLSHGKYDQAANVLQQLLNQHTDLPLTPTALVDLVRLYSSSEVMHTEKLKESSKLTAEDQLGLLKYATYTANRTLQSNASLGDDPALTFQRAVATRLSGNPRAAQGRLTRLKRNRQAGIWRSRALAEQWLASDRKDDPPLPIVTCQRTNERPHLDGQLTESFWAESTQERAEFIRFRYDNEFLYLAISQAKNANLAYAADARPRTYDADLSQYDHVRLLLDADRDYATCFELAVDHRGWTNDRCWRNTDWNLKWFVATGADDSHWTIETAIPWEQLVYQPPQSGDAWAISTERFLPNSGSSPNEPTFSLLLFQ